jgi:hypothetical protein
LTLMVVPNDQVRISRPVKENSVSADSGAIISNLFCPNYGSRIYKTVGLMAYMIFIIASTLGDPEVFSLNVNLYVSKALSWYQSHAETMLSETMPTSKN